MSGERKRYEGAPLLHLLCFFQPQFMEEEKKWVD